MTLRPLALATLLLGICPSIHAAMRVLVDHVGYDTDEPHKLFLVEGTAQDKPQRFILHSPTGTVILAGDLHPAGPVDHWTFLPSEGGGPRTFWIGDLGPISQEGHYTLEVTDAAGARAQTCDFEIAHNLLEQKTISDIVFYFKGQRASGDFERADEHLHLPAQLGGGLVNLGGGWYDATGDYGIHLSHQNLTSFFNPQQVPLVVWSLLASYDALGERNDPNFVEYRHRMLDEALFGADFLVRLKRAGQSFLESISAPGKDKLASDREVGNPNWRTQLKTSASGSTEQVPDAKPTALTFQAGFRSGAGLAIAALARASTMPQDGDFSRAQYLQTARDAFDFLAAHNRELLNDGTENILDDYCALLAATELFRASHADRYRAAAQQRAASLIARLTTLDGHPDVWRADSASRPFFHPSDAGLPVIALLRYNAVAVTAAREHAAIRDVVRRSMASELRLTHEQANPFGYARQLIRLGDGTVRTAFFFPHGTEAAPWWQGENARLASLASAARLAAIIFPEDAAFQQQLRAYADDQMHWILGRNPFDSSMLLGTGHGNAPYMFFHSYQYTSAPGAVINGITAAETDEDGIAFNEGFAVTGKDEDWRWTEEWLPHAAWFLYAASLPHQ